METSNDCAQTRGTSNYSNDGPWMFKGKAFYQIHLVKADAARKCIPKDLRLVQAFGYTLGGMYMAHYDDSPAGKFDELVVIAGTVWNWPTSCAWAARVLVNSKEACDHGRKVIGLPSHFAAFSRRVKVMEKPQQEQRSLFTKLWARQMSQTGKCSKPKDKVEITINESNGLEIKAFMESKTDHRWMGPSMKFPLPSFSGCTHLQPHLLKYSCSIQCRIQFVNPATISVSCPALNNDCHGISESRYGTDLNRNPKVDTTESEAQNMAISVLSSRPIIALAFNDMQMLVRTPVVELQRTNEL